MTRTALRKTLIAAAGGFLAAALVLLMVLSSGLDPAGRSPLATAAGWLVPIAAGALTAFVAWALENGRPTRAGRTSCDWRTTGVSCPECGGLLRTEWRLCPHCGHRISAA